MGLISFKNRIIQQIALFWTSGYQTHLFSYEFNQLRNVKLTHYVKFQECMKVFKKVEMKYNCVC